MTNLPGKHFANGTFRTMSLTISVRSLHLKLKVSDARLEVFLSRVKEDILKIEAERFNYPNLSKEERQALKSLEEDENIIIKPANKQSVTVVLEKI